MSKISIKTDFADGEKLFAQDLNNNFLVIEAGINANEENLQEVIDQAIVELDNELEEITADRGWDWNGGDRVTFYKGDTTAINSREIVNGQLLYNTATGETALDDNGSRITTGSGNVVVVSDTEPTNLSTKEWIKPTTIEGTPTAEEYFRDVQNNWVKVITAPSGDTLPIGAIAQFGGSVAPTNWLFCNGQAVSRETYSELFSAIGTTYGDGDGSTTFNLPDFSSRSPMGIGQGTDDNSLTETTTLGQIKGEYKHTLSTAEMPSHIHMGLNWINNPVSLNAGSVTTGYKLDWNSTAPPADTGLRTNPAGGDQAHNIIQPVLGVNFIIKAKQSVGLLGTITTDITDANVNAVPNAITVKDYTDAKTSFNQDIVNVPVEIALQTYNGSVYSAFKTLYNVSLPVNFSKSGAMVNAPIEIKVNVNQASTNTTIVDNVLNLNLSTADTTTMSSAQNRRIWITSDTFNQVSALSKYNPLNIKYDSYTNAAWDRNYLRIWFSSMDKLNIAMYDRANEASTYSGYITYMADNND